MGLRGPAGKDPAARMGHQTQEQIDAVDRFKPGTVIWKKADPDWHPDAVNWYESLNKSGQKAYYQQSDQALAWIVAGQLSDYLEVGHGSGKGAQLFGALLTAMSSLGTSLADRRRLQLEIQLGEPKEDPAAKIQQALKDLASARPKAA